MGRLPDLCDDYIVIINLYIHGGSEISVTFCEDLRTVNVSSYSVYADDVSSRGNRTVSYQPRVSSKRFWLMWERFLPSGGELICILFSHEALPDPWSLQWESLAPLTKASLIVLCSQRLIMFSLVFGLSGRVPLESRTAAGYNGERHLLPTKTGKMEVGSETECE